MADSDYPEHDKLRAVQEQSQAIGEFLDLWCPEQGLVLCELVHRGRTGEGYDEYVPARRNLQALLAEHFEIDLDVLEAEKEAMLVALRAVNAA